MEIPQNYTSFMQNPVIRAFFAVEIGEKCQSKIDEIQSDLKKEIGQNYKWVRKDQLHLTMKFISKLSRKDISEIINDLEVEFKDIESFDFEISGFGAFLNLEKPRVLWLGINHPGELAKINESLQEVCEKYGYEKENRPFSPHLTIARIKKQTPFSEYKKITEFLWSCNVGSICRINVNKISLIQSTLTPEGPIYREIEKIGF